MKLPTAELWGTIIKQIVTIHSPYKPFILQKTPKPKIKILQFDMKEVIPTKFEDF